MFTPPFAVGAELAAKALRTKSETNQREMSTCPTMPLVMQRLLQSSANALSTGKGPLSCNESRLSPALSNVAAAAARGAPMVLKLRLLLGMVSELLHS